MDTLGGEPADGAEVRLLASLISSSQLPPPRPSQAWLLRCVHAERSLQKARCRVRTRPTRRLGERGRVRQGRLLKRTRALGRTGLCYGDDTTDAPLGAQQVI
jgi:hypothetical protein